MRKLSEELRDYFFSQEKGETVSLREILEIAGERLFGFLFVILSLPSALPLPAPGYSTPFGLLIFLLAIQFMAGATIPWLPNRMLSGRMKTDTARKFVELALPWLRRLETVTKPRLIYICTGWGMRVIIGVAIALMAISMMIPIPGTNTAPAMGIFVTAFGLQEDDGFIVLAGLTICLLAGIVSTSIIIATVWGGMSIVDWLKHSLGK